MNRKYWSCEIKVKIAAMSVIWNKRCLGWETQKPRYKFLDRGCPVSRLQGKKRRAAKYPRLYGPLKFCHIILIVQPTCPEQNGACLILKYKILAVEINYFISLLIMGFYSSTRICFAKIWMWYLSRQGVIIEFPPNGLFHDACDIILTSWSGFSEMVDDYDDDDRTLVVHK